MKRPLQSCFGAEARSARMRLRYEGFAVIEVSSADEAMRILNAR
jgi:hypothetical protein